MFFTVYRTTNKVNGKYYIGVHKTKNPMDDYLGSGKHLLRAIAKYGEENFVKEILLSGHSPEAAFALEFELVEKHRGDSECDNMRQGGSGGFDYINRVGLNGNNFVTEDAVKRRVESHRKKFDTNPEYRQRVIEHINRIRKLKSPEKQEQARLKAVEAWKGSHHTSENRKKFSELSTGQRNNNFGARWINKNGQVQKVKAEELQHWLDSGWVRGKKEVVKKGPRSTLASLAPDGMNWCSMHKRYLSVEKFHRDKNESSGYKQHCIECRKKKREGKNW
jgi:hypothetical protein